MGLTITRLEAAALHKEALIRIRPVEASDAEFMHRWSNDPEYSGEYEPYEPSTLDEILAWIRGDKHGASWYVMERRDGERVGQMVATRNGDTVKVGYRVIPPMRGRGYCTEAVRILVEHMFRDEGVLEVRAETNPENTASKRVLERNGFKEHEYRRDAVRINGVLMDGIIFRLTRDDYGSP
jgi:RimJ/RimL family protein N-acetyltransferase